MAATGQSGYVFKNSGTTPPAVPEKPISWDHRTPGSASETQQGISKPGPNPIPAHNTVESSTNTTHNDVELTSNKTVNGPTRETQSPSLIKAQTDRANDAVNSLKQEFGKNFVMDSQDLALQDHEIKGEIQKQAILEGEVRDLGWHKNLNDMPDPLIGGVPNQTLFAMVRRFNKDVFDVRAVRPGKASGLDLTEAWDNDHATDKITLNLQRVYLSIVLGLASFGKQISRLRSWKETRRTTAFCTVYFVAWIFNLLMPLALGTLILITGSEHARNILFPPVPLALVNVATGGLQKPQAGQLGTTDTLTGAPEKAPGEAREEEAANFVDNIRHMVARAVGMHDSNDNEGDPLEGKVPKPIRKAIKSVKAVGTAPGHATDTPGENMTQEPMEELLWDKVNPTTIQPVIKAAPHVIGEIVDNWERFANAISPTPPFPRLSFLRIEVVLVPLFLTSLLVPQYMVYKGTGFAIGFGLFGDPIISRGLQLLNEKFPAWIEMLEPKNNILRGVPTNNQVTLTLLRIGEAHNSPIPPVPRTKATDAHELADVDVDEIPLDATNQEVVDAIEPSSMPKGHGDHSSSPNSANVIQDTVEVQEQKPKHPRMSKVIGMLKGQTKATVHTKLAVDHVRAAAGSHKARGHLGVLPKDKNLIYAGPAEFVARLDGKKGWLYIPSSASNANTAEARLLFTTEDPRGKHDNIDQFDKSKSTWSIAIADIRRLKRATAFASKPAEMAADWSQERQLLGSLEIDDETGKVWRFTAIPERDELFNRLVALGRQRWENM